VLSPGGRNREAGRKRPRLAFNTGRVIVGPRYSAEPAAHVVGGVGNWVIRCVWQKVDTTGSATNLAGKVKTEARAPRIVPGAGSVGLN
jgi:hypothetical protein